jgi:RNA polymerase sigma-70 factor (ECF subfamily)
MATVWPRQVQPFTCQLGSKGLMIDEEALATRLAVDLDAHFESLVRTYQDRLYGFALRLTGSPPDAEECTQDTFFRAYRALSAYPAERVATLRLKAWLYQIELNVVRNRVRGGSLDVRPIDERHVDGVASGVRDEQPETALLAREGLGRIAAELKNLPERYAASVVLRHVQGLSYEEIADVLNQPVGTTKSDVHRGLRLLREALQPELVLMGEDQT